MGFGVLPLHSPSQAPPKFVAKRVQVCGSYHQLSTNQYAYNILVVADGPSSSNLGGLQADLNGGV